MQYTINPNELEAINLASSDEETRYYLCGVCIEINDDGSLALVATNGHMLASLRMAKDAPKDNFILRTDDIKKAITMVKAARKAAKGLKNDIHILIDRNGMDLTVSVALLDAEGAVIRSEGQFTPKAIDGTFPDYRRVFPVFDGKEQHCKFGFCAEYIARFGKMAILLGQNLQHITVQTSSPTGPMLIGMNKSGSTFAGVLMPVRVND